MLHALTADLPYVIGIAVFVCVAAAVSALVKSLDAKDRLAVFTRARPGTISQLRPGFVALRGTAAPDGPLLLSPMTRTPCIHYLLKPVEPAPGRSARASPLFDATFESDCILHDGTGSVRVCLGRAELLLTSPAAVTHREFEELSQDVQEEVVDRCGDGSGFQPRWRGVRFTEELILPGQELFVHGTAVKLKDGTFVVAQAWSPLLVTDQAHPALVTKLQRLKARALKQAAALASVAAVLALATELWT